MAYKKGDIVTIQNYNADKKYVGTTAKVTQKERGGLIKIEAFDGTEMFVKPGDIRK